MALVIEDGTGVVDATSYATVAQARAYALSRGRAFPADTMDGNAQAETLLLRAMDYLESVPLPLSSIVAIVNENGGDADDLWGRLARAQIVLAIEAQTVALVSNTTGPRVKKTTVEDVVSIEYADEDSGQPRFPLVDALLAPLLSDSSDGAGFATVRV